jgi:hypothetical protein
MFDFCQLAMSPMLSKESFQPMQGLKPALVGRTLAKMGNIAHLACNISISLNPCHVLSVTFINWLRSSHRNTIQEPVEPGQLVLCAELRIVIDPDVIAGHAVRREVNR